VVGAGVDEGLLGLSRINAAGGSLTPFTRVDTGRKELSHQVPRVLADGKTVLFTIWFGSAKGSEIALTSLDDGKVVPLGVSGLVALGIVDDYLVYVNNDAIVMAVHFDARRRRVEGTPTVVQEDVRINTGGGSDHKEAFLTHAGGLVYLRGNENRRLVWVDRKGATSPVLDAEREFVHVRLSPDGRRIAASIITGAQVDIWTIDAADGTLTRLSTTGASRNPVWSADGRRILYASTHGGRAAFWWQPADGSGASELAVVPPHNPWFVDLSPDGRNVVYNAIYNGTFNLEVVPLDSSGRPRDLVASPTAIERNARFSPDGKWIAHVSNESGRDEVYVRPFAGAGGRVQVSVDGGGPPVWSRDGREIFYREGARRGINLSVGGRMIAAAVAFDPEPRVVSRTALFSGQYLPDYDVSADGKRFLMVESQASGVSLVVIPNWRTELRRLVNQSSR
jgi:serine/threonine-protein kinase